MHPCKPYQVGQAYIDREFFDTGITVIAMKGTIRVVADVLEEASVMPIKYIRRSGFYSSSGLPPSP